MRIAFFLAAYPVLSETFVIRQIRGMIDLGHDVTVVTGKYHPEVADPLAGKVRLRAIRTACDPHRSIPSRVAHGAAALLGSRFRGTLLRAIKAAKGGYNAPLADLAGTMGRHLGSYDAIIAHFGPPGVRAEFLRSAGVIDGPIATIFHGLDITEIALIEQMKPFYQQLFARTERLLPISNLWRERLMGWGAEDRKITVLRMGVDIDEAAVPAFDAPIQSPLRVLSVARLVEKKGIAYAIDGVAKAKSDIRYQVIGTGPLEQELHAAAQPSDDAIAFLGPQPHGRVFAELGQSDVFLLPSVTAANGDMEGIPVSLMEAMANGVLVLATRHSGIPELIEDGVCGLLVDERYGDGIAAALDRIAAGAVDVVKLRQAAFEKVVGEYNNRKLDRQLEAVVAEMKAGR
ncbi:glycosyltransferase [Sphingomonas sp. Leaf10]|uniref:glycosyltransferase n=1 Tax=Sphingomonas sp. Leaf10 TaxID=1735676 RepID=UPI0006FFDE59|nr:glycosyltransferase [Sphingomonas sp. Leaf10]KQM35848.1 hypothetical protein ASE59_17615 [Sphingomonas sp. Leaf10]